MTDREPIFFACAGCSVAAKLSWDLAKELARRSIASIQYVDNALQPNHLALQLWQCEVRAVQPNLVASRRVTGKVWTRRVTTPMWKHVEFLREPSVTAPGKGGSRCDVDR